MYEEYKKEREKGQKSSGICLTNRLHLANNAYIMYSDNAQMMSKYSAV